MKLKNQITIPAALAASLLLTACGAEHLVNIGTAYQKQDVPSAPADDAFVRTQTDFAVSLLREQVRENPGQNIVLSPYSLSQTLAMSANGACGTTRTEMEQVLGGGMPLDDLNAYFAGMPSLFVSNSKQ